MNELIKCSHLEKSYQDVSVLKNFNYTFGSKGLYVLFGNSGTGKTTFINILLGLTNFEKGTIYFNGKQYINMVHYEDIAKYISYISQDSYFVDYLSVYDNIKVCSPNSSNNEIEKVLQQVQLENKKNIYPNKLSGGERQRLAIAQLLLKKKKILILDEPTSSLDHKNRDLFFQIINALKEKVLIICCTHDQKIFEYADSIINFNSLENYNQIEKNNDKNTNHQIIVDEVQQIKGSILLKYILKKDKYKNREKKSAFFLILVFLISLLLCFICFGYKEKLLQSLINRYSVNMVKVFCSIEEENYCDNILQKYNSTYKIYNYAENIPSVEDEVVDGSSSAIYFDPTLLTLPSEKQRFKISDSILYGKYFEQPNQVMLGYKLAFSISEEPEKLIGTELEIALPDGNENFIITGIFNEFSPSEINYLKSVYNDLAFDSYMYINSDYVSKYLYDEQLGFNEEGDLKSTVLTVYFDNTKDLYKFYKDYVNKDPRISGISANDFINGFVEYEQDIELAKMIFYPLVICVTAVSVLFYFQIQKIELIYNKHISAVYQYYGFTTKQIEYANILYSLINILKKYMISIVLAILVSNLVNMVIEYHNILEFKLFMIDYKVIILMLLSLSIFSVFLSLVNQKKVQVKGWFNVLKERSDLL